MDMREGHQYLQVTRYILSNIKYIIDSFCWHRCRYQVAVLRLDTATLVVRLKWDSCYRTRFYRHYGEHNFSYIHDGGSKAPPYFWCRAWRRLKKKKVRERERDREEERRRTSQKFVFNFSGTVLFYSVSPHTLRETCAASQAIFYIINVALPAARVYGFRCTRGILTRPRVISGA